MAVDRSPYFRLVSWDGTHVLAAAAHLEHKACVRRTCGRHVQSPQSYVALTKVRGRTKTRFGDCGACITSIDTLKQGTVPHHLE